MMCSVELRDIEDRRDNVPCILYGAEGRISGKREEIALWNNG